MINFQGVACNPLGLNTARLSIYSDQLFFIARRAGRGT
jgi:hypothetical protein